METKRLEYLEVTHEVFLPIYCYIRGLPHVVAAVKPFDEISRFRNAEDSRGDTVYSNNVSWKTRGASFIYFKLSDQTGFVQILIMKEFLLYNTSKIRNPLMQTSLPCHSQRSSLLQKKKWQTTHHWVWWPGLQRCQCSEWQFSSWSGHSWWRFASWISRCLGHTPHTSLSFAWLQLSLDTTAALPRGLPTAPGN